MRKNSSHLRNSLLAAIFGLIFTVPQVAISAQMDQSPMGGLEIK